MAGYNNPRYCEIENEVLRSRLAKYEAGAKELINAVERYARQECLRSELMNTKEHLKNILK